MIRLLTLCAVLSLGSFRAVAGAPNTLTPEESAAGWKLIFDGKTTAGWVAIGKAEFPDGWNVVDGALFHPKGAGGGDIVTTKAYGDFELGWEWKIAEGGNSGLKYNLADPKKAVGFEYQMLDDANHPDGKKGPTRQSGALYDLLAAPPGKKLNPPGQWNVSRIVVQGNFVEHWLNGAKTVQFEIGSDALKAAIAQSKFKSIAGFGEKAKSPILLQDHHDEVAVRSIKLRVLDAK